MHFRATSPDQCSTQSVLQRAFQRGESWGQRAVVPLIQISKRPFFLATQQGLAYSLPLVMVGAFCLAILHLPIPVYQDLMVGLFGDGWHEKFNIVTNATFGVASIAALCGMAYSYASTHNQRHTETYISPGTSIITTLGCYFIVLSFSDANLVVGAVSLKPSFLTAIISAAITSVIFIPLASRPFLRLKQSSTNTSMKIYEALSLAPAATLTIAIIALGFLIFGASPLDQLPNAIIGIIHLLFDEAHNEIVAGTLYTAIAQVLWFLGMHGQHALMFVENTTLAQAIAENLMAVQNGMPPTNVVTKSFLNTFALLGGSGSTLCLIFAILHSSKDINLRRFVLLALIPTAINVNEPILFGIPVLFNPIYAIPFILTPVVQILTASLATLVGFIPVVANDTHWTSPIFLSGYVATGNSISGILMQLLNLLIGIGIYLPFVKLKEKNHARDCQLALNSLTRNVISGNEPTAQQAICINRLGIEGAIARHLAQDMARIHSTPEQIQLDFQPQIHSPTKQVIGMEALLRWNHPIYGRIAPPVAIAIAEDIGRLEEFEAMIFQNVCQQISKSPEIMHSNIIVSFNLTPGQLRFPGMADILLDILTIHNIPTHRIELEITETVVVSPDVRTLQNLQKLRDHGMLIAIDDFGMGHTSLRYLRELPVDVVKIDRSLTQDIESPVNQQIITSIVNLSQALDLKIIVEGVEDAKTVGILEELGCNIFQGYYYSRPLSLQDAVAFTEQQKAQAPVQ